jgi:hypothetical protein
MSSFRSQPTGQQKAPLLSIERVVAILTPLFTAAGGALSTGIGSAVGIPAKDFTDLFIAGAVPALGSAITWLLGRQKFLKAEADTQAMVERAYRAVMADQKAAPAIEDIAHLLEAHQGVIIHELAQKIGAPASAEEIAQQMLDQAEQRQAAAARAAAALSGAAGGGASGGASPPAAGGPATAGAVAGS